MIESLPLVAVGALLALGPAAIMLGPRPAISSIVYVATTAVSMLLLALALAHLLSGAAPVERSLPLGLPWIGAILISPDLPPPDAGDRPHPRALRFRRRCGARPLPRRAAMSGISFDAVGGIFEHHRLMHHGELKSRISLKA